MRFLSAATAGAWPPLARGWARRFGNGSDAARVGRRQCRQMRPCVPREQRCAWELRPDTRPPAAANAPRWPAAATRRLRAVRHTCAAPPCATVGPATGAGAFGETGTRDQPRTVGAAVSARRPPAFSGSASAPLSASITHLALTVSRNRSSPERASTGWAVNRGRDFSGEVFCACIGAAPLIRLMARLVATTRGVPSDVRRITVDASRTGMLGLFEPHREQGSRSARNRTAPTRRATP